MTHNPSPRSGGHRRNDSGRRSNPTSGRDIRSPAPAPPPGFPRRKHSSGSSAGAGGILWRRAGLVSFGGGEGVEAVDVGGGLGPFVLHDHQHGKAELRHDLDRFRADGGAEETPFRMRYRARPDRGAGDPVVFAVEAEAVLRQRHADDLRRLDEAWSRLALVDAEALILDAGGA